MKKKLTSLLLIISIIAFAWNVNAEDNFNFDGNYRIRGWMIQNPSFDSDADNNQSYYDQRFRVKYGVDIMENVKGMLQVDFSEGEWGSSYNDYMGWSSTKEEAEVQIDHAYVTIDEDLFKITAGQHYSGVGNYLIWDQDATGITLNIKTPVAILINYSKMDERGSLVDENGTEDADFYGLNVGYSKDDFQVNLTFATRKDYSEEELDPWGVGLQTNVEIGPVAMNLEVDQFGGTWGENVDVIGTQAFLEGSVAIKENGKVGLRIFYATGTDADDEVQATGVNVGGWTFNPLGFGDTSSYAGEMIYYFYPAGNMDAYFYGGGPSIFDPAGANAGVIGFSPYTFFSPTDNVTLFANIGYLTPQDDSNTPFNSLTSVSLSVDWKVYEKVILSAGYNYSGIDTDDDSAKDARNTILTQLMVKF